MYEVEGRVCAREELIGVARGDHSHRPWTSTRDRCQGNMGTPSFRDPGSPYFLKNRDPGSLFLWQI